MTQAPGLAPISPSARPRSHPYVVAVTRPDAPSRSRSHPICQIVSPSSVCRHLRPPVILFLSLPPFLPLGFLQPPQIIWSSRSGSPCRKPNWPTNEEISRQRENTKPASLAGAEAPRSPHLASPSFLLPQAHSHKCAGVGHLRPQMPRCMTKRVAVKILRSRERE